MSYSKAIGKAYEKILLQQFLSVEADSSF